MHLSAAKAMIGALKALKAGDLDFMGELGINWSEFNDLIGTKRWRQMESEFGAAPKK